MGVTPTSTAAPASPHAGAAVYPEENPVTRPKLSAKRAELIDRMKHFAANPNPTWAHVPGVGLTVRHTVCGLTTPDWARERKPIAGLPGELTRPYWDEPTYDQHVFLTVVGYTGKPILGVARAPWVRRSDSDLTLARALEILDNPAVVL